MINVKVLAVFVGFIGCAGPAFCQRPTVQKVPFYRSPQNLSLKPRQNLSVAVVNAASFQEGISPGGLATIFGENLTTVNGVVLANTDPLPTYLAGVEVFVSGIPAPIYSIAYSGGLDQISIQVPYAAPTGPLAAQIEVVDYGSTVAGFWANSYTEDPGIFVYQDNYAVVQASDYSLIGPDNPAIPGEPLMLYVTGLGPLNQDLDDGYGAPMYPPFAETEDPYYVVVDRADCYVFFSGLAPGFVGLYQVNFYLSPDAPPGNLPIYVQSPYATSTTAVLPVR